MTRSAASDTAAITRALRARSAITAMSRSIQSARLDGNRHVTNFAPLPDGSKSEAELDDSWYEAFADQVHKFGKAWPEPLTEEEYDACEKYADSQVRRPECEKTDE